MQNYDDTQLGTYVWQKVDDPVSWIHITLPTTMTFGTFEKENREISSNDYDIINHSDKVTTKIDLVAFEQPEGVSNAVRLLESGEADPSSETNAARLHLLVNDDNVTNPTIHSLTEQTENKELIVLPTNERATLKFGGQYFGTLEEQQQINHQMMLKFSVISD